MTARSGGEGVSAEDRPSGGADAAEKSLLRAFSDYLMEHAVPYGVVSRRDADRVFERHVLDSTRAVACIPAGTRTVVDVGSGGGLPGIPVAICRPDLRVYLLEVRRRRVALLEAARQELALSNVTVVAGRAEEVSLIADVGLARALGDPEASWRLASRLLSEAGCLIYFAGRSWSADRWNPRLGAAGASATVCARSGDPAEGPLVMMRR
jgi:16S rRNA (guanine(527)-N(7))-methyltransferase RsmG